MYRDQLRYGRDPQEVVRTKPSTFEAPLRWRNSAEASSSPLVFTCSWSDWFHPSADPWRDDAWSIVKQCPTLTFQILTKRPELIRERLPADWGPNGYSNVWLGVSIENHRFTWRAEELLEVPARIRFVSAEPLLGKIDLSPFLALNRINWVIVGGESGGRRGHPPRLMRPEWATAIREQCEEAGVDFFFNSGEVGCPAALRCSTDGSGGRRPRIRRTESDDPYPSSAPASPPQPKQAARSLAVLGAVATPYSPQ